MDCQDMKISLFNAHGFKSYSVSMVESLVTLGLYVDLIGNDDMSTAPVAAHANVNYLNLRGSTNPDASAMRKIARILKYYYRLLKYAAATDSQLFHLQTDNKFALLDRTLLNLYYKLLGKKLVYTAHNIDEKQRDGGDTIINRLSLKFAYRSMDHLFVHTDKMKRQLVDEFDVAESRITIIPHGILNTAPKTDLTRSEARAMLRLDNQERVLLFFGLIAPYKGLEYLIEAMDLLRRHDGNYRLIIAGQLKSCRPYWESIERLIEGLALEKFISGQIRFIPDEEVEVFFKASDVLVLPYKFIFQSGVPFLSYSFGLPIVATDVGSLSDLIEEGNMGMICRKEDPGDLADTISKYFDSALYRNLEDNRKNIISYVNEKYSWDGIGTTIHGVYKTLLSV